VRQDRARQIPDTMDFPLASLVEPVSVCLEALAQARLKPGNSLLIVGDGPFGVLTARLAEAFDLSTVVIVGRHDFRLSFAGSALKLNSRNRADPVRDLRNTVGGAGYEVAILGAGTPQAFAECFACLKPRGRLVVFSAISGKTPVDLFALLVKELAIVGARNDQGLFDEAVRMLSNPALGISELITHRFSLAEFDQALHLASTGRDQVMKVTFVF
jgi:L-iditol 2-dehydrogenase